ncbi:alpha/beta fold hydrolase [Kitasatospora cathayae]|uniref:Alpha/beta hydrolase n=1 Tax=Kitasatospora cathayae TaxID=3004092 RepID=A0ABY7PYU5_9ACTN|nr:alpha/beta hydrolase [Kitasatospora sp. HUAS 3-15]WBP85622.1 alpha/beta hydrolase [Kitasatospora sp. HUAS 3-15]
MSAHTAPSRPPRLAPFLAAYDKLLARWPVPVEPLTVRTAHGTTRINACGPADGHPLVLLHGGGATSTMWYANVGAWAGAGHRVLAIDLIGDPGRSVHDGTPLGDVPGLLGWLDAVLDQLGVPAADFCGHSYGAWIALEYALHAPARVSRLALLDPTLCFAGYRPGYLLRVLPLFLPRRTPARARSYLDWDATDGPRTDPDWRELYALGYADFPASPVITGPRPTPTRLGTLTTPLLALYAEHSRAHDPHRTAVATHQAVPHATVTTVPGASHHNLPMTAAPEVNHQVLNFLTPGRT